MVSKVTPYFILTAGGMAAPPPLSVENKPLTENTMQKPSRRECDIRTSKNIVTMTRNEFTRKRMDVIRQNLEDRRTRHLERQGAAVSGRGIPRIGDEMVPHTYSMPESHESKMRREIKQREVELVSLSNSKNADVFKQPVPYVYFVVSMDRTSQCSNSLTESADDQCMKEFRQKSTISKCQKSREERQRVEQQMANEITIKSVSSSDTTKHVSHKQILFPDSYKFHNSPPRNPPATPATIGSTFLLDKQDTENFSLDLSNKASICDIGDFTSLMESRSSTKNVPTRIIELPHISAEQQRKNLGTALSSETKYMELVPRTMSSDANKKVHFSDAFDLPVIRGNGIVFSEGMSIASDVVPITRSSTIPFLISNPDQENKRMEQNEKEKLPKSSAIPRTRKKVMPLSLPKIDIVSDVYDELIIKAIKSYIQELPTSSKNSQIARHLLRQMKEKTLTAADLTHKNNKEDNKTGKTSTLTITELPNEELSRSCPGHSGGKMAQPITKRSTKSRDREFSTIVPTCFKMEPPGKTKTDLTKK